MKRNQSGFTLVEIAIVLVIVGLLLGGILKGQELVQNAKVRNVADQQSAIKAAYYAFQDRYRALPGDYVAAGTNIPNVAAATNGDGNAQIAVSGTALAEPVYAWHHLTNAGFISCSECAAQAAPGPPTAANSPSNANGGVMTISFDAVYQDAAAPPTSINNLKSGGQIPSNLLAEVDRKIDDGNPQTGAMRFSIFAAGGGVAPTAATCLIVGPPIAWQVQTPSANCGAATLF